MSICFAYCMRMVSFSLVSGVQVADTILLVGGASKSEALFAGDSCPMLDVPSELETRDGIAMAMIEGSKVQSFLFTS